MDSDPSQFLDARTSQEMAGNWMQTVTVLQVKGTFLLSYPSTYVIRVFSLRLQNVKTSSPVACHLKPGPQPNPTYARKLQCHFKRTTAADPDVQPL